MNLMNETIAHPWMDDAACVEVDPDLYFGEARWGVMAAKKICATCPAATECAIYALRTRPEAGIWGGMTIVELRRLRKKLAQRAWRAKTSRKLSA